MNLKVKARIIKDRHIVNGYNMTGDSRSLLGVAMVLTCHNLIIPQRF